MMSRLDNSNNYDGLVKQLCSLPNPKVIIIENTPYSSLNTHVRNISCIKLFALLNNTLQLISL